MRTALEWAREWPGIDLEPGEVHLGRLRVEQSDPAAENHLTSDELERASSFRFEVDRARYVASRGALRSLLAGYLGIEPGSVSIVTDAGGKPYLSDVAHPDSIQFNVSHSGRLVVIGITKDVPIGLDVEEIRSDIPYRDMAARFFSPKELDAFAARPVEERLDHFYAVWTRKEAYLKGIGAGLSIPPEGFSVTLGEHDATPVDDPSRSQRWWTAGVDVWEGFHAALALPRDDWTIRPFEIVRSGG